MPRDPNCTACGLCKVAKTVCLWGDGNADARMVVIGQNPGREEDAAGKPFIGASGKLLRDMLAKTGVDSADVYITNAVKCWTQDNRKPELSEIKACRTHLEAELAELNPKVIVVLGDTALQALLSKKGITAARSQFHQWHGVPVVATYHPAYALRSPQFVGDLQADLNRAATYVNPAPPPSRAWEWGQVTSDSLDYHAASWSYDIETNGKDLDDPELEILLLGIYDGKTCVVFGYDKIEFGLERMAKARREGVRIWGHNSIGFDSEYLLKKCGTYVECDDTMILAHCVDENGPLGLEQLACTHLGVSPWKQQVTWSWEQVLADPQLMEQAAAYNAEDTINTWHLAKALLEKAAETGVDRDYDIRRKGTVVFEHVINRNGIALDVPRLRTLRDELVAESRAAADEFERIIGYTINLNSPPQVAKALFETLGLQPPKFTATGKASTDEETLKELMLNRSWVPGDPARAALDALLKSRKSGKLASMLEAYESKAEQRPDHWRILPHYFSWRTTTARSTADKGFQQWPHDPRVRGLLTARPGYVLLAADYSQLQMRLAAQISGSEPMRRLFIDKIDPHTWMAGKITGKDKLGDVTKEERYESKPVNFMLLFGAEPYTLRIQALKAYDLIFSPEQSQFYHDVFHKAYKLEPWYASVGKELRDTGQIRSPLGGIRHLPNIYAGNQSQRNEALRQAINAPVQHLEVMIAYLAMWEAYLLGLHLVAFLHDALYVEVPEAEAEQASVTLKYLMETRVPQILEQQYGYRLDVPLEVEIEAKPCYATSINA